MQRRLHAVCGATILIRRWIYGLNHRRIISDSRALLPPTETYACLFADNCAQLSLCPLFSPAFSPPLSPSPSPSSSATLHSSARRFHSVLRVLCLFLLFFGRGGGGGLVWPRRNVWIWVFYTSEVTAVVVDLWRRRRRRKSNSSNSNLTA